MLCFLFLLHITCRSFQSTMTPSPFALGATLVASIVTVNYAHAATDSLQTTLVKPARAINGVAPTTRSHWMRQANQALADVLGTPCPFAAFGTAIVNHTGHGLGNLICIGANTNPETGNPTLHGNPLPPFPLVFFFFSSPRESGVSLSMYSQRLTKTRQAKSPPSKTAPAS